MLQSLRLAGSQQFGYKLGQGLRVIGRGRLALIELLDSKGRFGLGYEPTHEELFQASRGKKRKCAALGMSFPHIKTTFPAPIEVIMPEPFKELEDGEPNLACIIQLCPKEFSVKTITSFEDDMTSAI